MSGSFQPTVSSFTASPVDSIHSSFSDSPINTREDFPLSFDLFAPLPAPPPSQEPLIPHIIAPPPSLQVPIVPTISPPHPPHHHSHKTMAPTTQTGVHLLPIPGTRSAPKKFKGKFSEIKLFIKHYEKLCIKKGVTDDEERIENITQYCSRSVREFMEGLPSYSGKNWKLFS